MKELLYVSDCFVDSTVFESQVHTICNEHSKNFNVTLLALCNNAEMKKNGLSNAKYKLIKYKKPPKLFINYMQKIAIYTFKNVDLFKRCDLIHARGHIGAGFSLNICKKYNLNKKVISDIRGAVPEEILFTNKFANNYFSKEASKLENFVFKYSNYFYFVSENMKDHYINKYKLDKKNCSVFPTIVNEFFFSVSAELRTEKRKELKIDDKFVYIYVGGIDKWQNLDKILIAFSEKSTINNSLFLIIVTTDPKHVEELILDLNLTIKNILITTSKYKDVSSFLNAADAGLIIRDDNIINHVASPTKVNEYLACGLKVVDNLNEIGNISYSKKNIFYQPLKNIINEQENIYNELIDKIKR